MESGKVIASLETVGDSDDLFYDATKSRVYVVGDEGFVDVRQQTQITMSGLRAILPRLASETHIETKWTQSCTV
jgi:hypothetical protein